MTNRPENQNAPPPFVFNGLNASTGGYLQAPTTAEEFVQALLQANPKEVDPDTGGMRNKRNQMRREREGDPDAQHLGVKAGVNAAQLAEAGWGVIFPANTDQAIVDALKPLLDWRREQAGALNPRRFQIYTGGAGYRPNEQAHSFLARAPREAAPGPANPDLCPYYLLLVGGPEQIPFRFQQLLDVQYAVGRIAFDTPAEYRRYAENVVAVEQGRVQRPRRATFFGPASPDDRATELSAAYLVKPLADFSQQFTANGWAVAHVAAGDSTKARLARLMGGDDTPALLFTASHGLGFGKDDPLQRDYQGALVCQDWPGPLQWKKPLAKDFYFAYDDIPADADLSGMVAFFFACYGAATPTLDEFGHASGRRIQIAPNDFIARLPMKMLSHSGGGALAVVGHVDRAWGQSFLLDRAGSRVEVFESLLTTMIGQGHTIGMGLEYFNERYAELSAALTPVLEDMQFGNTSYNVLDVALQWTANNDAKGYILLGDPAVRLVGAETATPTGPQAPQLRSATPSRNVPPPVESGGGASFGIAQTAPPPAHTTPAPVDDFAPLVIEDGGFAHFYAPVATTVRPSIPPTKLPLQFKQIANRLAVAQGLPRGLDMQALDDARLLTNGFLAIPLREPLQGGSEIAAPNDMIAVYRVLRELGLPTFVTSDTLLFLYHSLFSATLRELEEQVFAPDLVALCRMLVRRLGEEYAQATGDLQLALLKAWIYAWIGLRTLVPPTSTSAVAQAIQQDLSALGTLVAQASAALQQPDGATAELRGLLVELAHVAQTPLSRLEAEKPPEAIAAAIDQVLQRMAQHQGYWPDPQTAATDWPLFGYSEDFSLYVPRGHYTRSAALQRYFVAMMWFGRMSFLLFGGDLAGTTENQFLISAEQARQQSLAATWIVKLIASETLPDGRRAQAVWARIAQTTAFYVGRADDLGVLEYKAAMERVAGAALDLTILLQPQLFENVRQTLATHRPPSLHAGLAAPIAESIDDQVAAEFARLRTVGFRLFGQAATTDAILFAQLVGPATGRPTNNRSDMLTCTIAPGGPMRGFPRGLDLMALLGSARARYWLTNLGDDAYERYAEVFARLQGQVAQQDDQAWHRSLGAGWLDSLRTLLPAFGEGYPSFMRNSAWQDRMLNTALASWAQLRHDTILYAKQSMTMQTLGIPTEPPPAVGFVEPVPALYARLLALTRMLSRGLESMGVTQSPALGRLNALAELLTNVLRIAERQLGNQALSETDNSFLRGIADQFERIQGEETTSHGDQRFGTSMIADIHTDANSGEALHVGTGLLDMLVVAYPHPDGRSILALGPILSFYEFRRNASTRMTDEEWMQLFDEDATLLGLVPPTRPAWVQGYGGEGVRA